MFRSKRTASALLLLLAAATSVSAQSKCKVIIDQDARGPGSTDQQAILLLIQSPQTEVLGITVVSGDQWRDEEVAHTLRTLEIIGRTDIPVVPGAIFPLVSEAPFRRSAIREPMPSSARCYFAPGVGRVINSMNSL